MAGNTLITRAKRWLQARLPEGAFSGLIVKASSGSFGIEVAGAGIALGLQVLLARALGPDSFGVYIYAFSWMRIAVLVGVMGFQTASTRFVGEYFGSEEWKKLSGFRAYSHRVVTIASFGAAAVLVVGAFVAYGNDPAQWWTFVGAGIALPLYAHTRLREGEIHGTKNIVSAQVPLRILRPVTFLLGVGVFWVGFRQVSAPTAMGINVAAVMIALGGSVVIARKVFPDLPEAISSDLSTGRWMRAARDMLLISGFGLLLRRTDVLMLGIIRDTTIAGQYSVASRLATLPVFVLSAVNAALMPIVADLYSKSERERLQKTITKWVRVAFFFAVLAVLALWGMGEQFLLLFGPEFTVAYWALAILLLGQFGNALTGPSVMILDMVNYERVSAQVLGTAAILNIGLNYLLIRMMGLEGAAVATAATVVCYNVVAALIAQYKCDVSTTVFG